MKIVELSQKGQLSDFLRCSGSIVALDIETTGLTRTDKIISAAITGKDENDIAFFGPELLPELLTATEGTTFILHNASFDLKHLAWNGVVLHSRYDYRDTLVLSHLKNENGSHGLGDLVKECFNDNYKEEFWGKYKKAEDAPKSALAEYNAKDVRYTLLLHERLQNLLRTDEVPESLIEHVHSLQRSLLETEIHGVAIDADYLMQKGVELKTRLESLLPQMREACKGEIELIEYELWMGELAKRKTPKGKANVAKPEFSFESPKQLQRLLYDHLKLPPQYKEVSVNLFDTKDYKKRGPKKEKRLSCDWESLENIKDTHAVIPLIQEFRDHTKVYGSYIEGTLERMVGGRVYPSFNVCGTATGRISHSNPNLGQLPRAGGIRGIYVPDEGHVLISADFSQLEVCLSAHFTRDENLLRIVNDGVSQHDITASALGIERSTAKTVNFGMQYGCSHFKVAKVLGVSPDEGKKAYDKYWKTYAGQKRVMDECSRKVDFGVPIISPFGRRRRFDRRKRQPWDGAYRQAWNALVQGTGSDCTSRAFYLVDAQLRERNLGRSLFTVHDEIICQVKKECWEEAQEILVQTMTKVGEEIALTVKLKAEPSGPQDRWED